MKKPATDTAYDIFVVAGLLTISTLFVCLMCLMVYGTLVVIGS